MHCASRLHRRETPVWNQPEIVLRPLHFAFAWPPMLTKSSVWGPRAGIIYLYIYMLHMCISSIYILFIYMYICLISLAYTHMYICVCILYIHIIHIYICWYHMCKYWYTHRMYTYVYICIEDAYGGSSLHHHHASCSYNLWVMFFSVALGEEEIEAAAGRAQGRNHFVFEVWKHPASLLELCWKQAPRSMKSTQKEALHFRAFFPSKTKWFVPGTLLAVAFIFTSQGCSQRDI